MICNPVTGTTPSGAPGWSTVRVLERCGSTNAVLAADTAAWDVLTTDHQVSGRGRLTRAWETPALAAVALSAAVPVPDHRMPDAGWLPLVTGVAVREALADHGLATALKWPNDVLVLGGPGEDDRKLCGILCEVATARDGGRVVVVGLGINVDQDRDELPVPQATSMALEGVPDVDREALVVSVLDHLAVRARAWVAGGLAQARNVEDYRAACATIGRRVDIHLPDGRIEHGEAVRVDADGRLVVAGPGGERAHAAGDVVHARLRPVAQ